MLSLPRTSIEGVRLKREPKFLHVLRAERDHRKLVIAAPLLNLQIAFGVSVLILFGNQILVFIDPEKDRLVARFGIVDILLK